jgi:hypothetical protein
MSKPTKIKWLKVCDWWPKWEAYDSNGKQIGYVMKSVLGAGKYIATMGNVNSDGFYRSCYAGKIAQAKQAIVEYYQEQQEQQKQQTKEE